MFGNLKDSKNGLVSGQDGKLESQQNSLLRFEDRKGQQRLAAKYKGKEERRERNERGGREAAEENGIRPGWSLSWSAVTPGEKALVLNSIKIVIDAPSIKTLISSLHYDWIAHKYG